LERGDVASLQFPSTTDLRSAVPLPISLGRIRSRPGLAFWTIRRYIAPMQRRFAFSTTTTTPVFPGCVGLRVTA
jgi:hypothetical protein